MEDKQGLPGQQYRIGEAFLATVSAPTMPGSQIRERGTNGQCLYPI